MLDESRRPPRAAEPQQVVGRAIQDLTATRLARGFVPVALTFFAGVAQIVTERWDSPGAMLLIFGAGATGGAMLGCGLRVTQRAFGRPARRWMDLVMLASVIPPLFAFYVLGWRGLRLFAVGGGAGTVAWALLFTCLGLWILRSWMRVVEVERLARVMQMGA